MISHDWNLESGSMGWVGFFYQLAVGMLSPKVRMGGGGGGNAQRSEVRIYIEKRK